MKPNYIDSNEEHLRILFELGILDDEEDWILYQKQEARFEENITEDTAKYFNA